jgi:peptidyl-prolyl cis-trans isomerase D
MSLQGLRDASEKTWAKLLMGLLIFSFVGWGAANWLLGEASTDSSLVQIGSESVSVAEFEQERNRQLAQMGREMQRQIFSDKTTLNYFSGQVLANMATRMLLEQHARNIGLVVSPASVANIIKQSPEFWENGAFSTDTFDAVLDVNGITEKYFADTLRRQELREMLLGSLNNNLPAPDFMTTAAFNARYSVRKIEFSTIKFDSFAAPKQPDEDDLRAVYAKNPKMVPEHRTISYVIVGAKMSQPDSFDRGYESVRSIEDMLAAGDAMRDAAKKMRATYRALEPMTIQRKTARGEVRDPILTDAVMQKLFAMEQGLESEIIESKSGFVIFRVEKIDPAHAVPFGGRRGELTALWKKSEQEKLAYARANEILADRKKLAVSATIGRASGAPLEVLNAAFAMDVGKTQIVRGEGVFYVVKVAEQIQPKANAAKKKEIANEIKSALPRMILDDYSGYLNRKYEIRPNEKLMRRLFN